MSEDHTRAGNRTNDSHCKWRNRVVRFGGPIPTDGTVYLICKSGGRSARAAEFLIPQGVEAVNVAGGTMAWTDSGRPVVAGGEPG